MDELIKAKMEEGESVIWQGGPDNIKALDKTNKKRIVTTSIISLLTAVALLLLYIINFKGDLKIALFLIILLALCAFAPVRSLLDAKAVRKLRYVVTDKNLMVVSSEAKAASLSQIRDAALRTDPDDHLSFLVGKRAVKAAPSNWRKLALTWQPGSADPDEPYDVFAFYAVADKAGLRRAIRQVLPNVQE